MGEPVHFRRLSLATFTIFAAGIAAACGVGPATTAETRSPTPTTMPTIAPTVAPPTIEPSPEASPTPGPIALPAAELVMPAGTVAGALGSYVVDGRGSDSPWLPFDSLPRVDVAATPALTVGFVDGAQIGEWSAVIADAADTRGVKQRGIEGVTLEPGGDLLVAGPLPAGRWVLAVRLFRADGRGDGVTYWALMVR